LVDMRERERERGGEAPPPVGRVVERSFSRLKRDTTLAYGPETNFPPHKVVFWRLVNQVRGSG